VGRQLVPLKRELDFVDRYLAIERIRFADRLRVEIDVEPEALDAAVPNLVLQPLVENAIRHGLAVRAQSGLVAITARRHGEMLRLEVRDDGPGLSRPLSLDDRFITGSAAAAAASGVGLANVRSRLRRLYPGKYRFAVENHPSGGVLATIEIPLARSPEEDSRA
jgi:LytS/YehU family sensor histidine kinase